jgi:hypothetical protein
MDVCACALVRAYVTSISLLVFMSVGRPVCLIVRLSVCTRAFNGRRAFVKSVVSGPRHYGRTRSKVLPLPWYLGFKTI